MVGPQSATRSSVDSRWKFLQAHDHGSFLKVTGIQVFASRSVRNRGFPGMSVAGLHVGFMVRPLVPSALVSMNRACWVAYGGQPKCFQLTYDSLTQSSLRLQERPGLASSWTAHGNRRR
jgi:hypothetical protein